MSYDKFILYISISLAFFSFIFAFIAWNRDDKIKTEDLEDGAVTRNKIADNAIDKSKISHNYFLSDNMRYFFEFWQKPVTTINIIEDLASLVGDGAINVIVPKMRTQGEGGIDTYDYFQETDFDVFNNFNGVVNQNFILVGANAEAYGGEVDETRGLLLNTSSTENDQAIAISNVGWANSDSQFDFTTSISVPDKENVMGFVGLKETADPYCNANGCSAYFFYTTASVIILGGDGGADIANAEGKLGFVYVTGETTYISMLPISIVEDKDYKLQITSDKERQLSIFVNDQQFSLNTTVSGRTNPTAVALGKKKSRSLDNNTRLKAVVGIQTLADSGKYLTCRYMKCLNTWE
jgi:hypothetical protein